MKKLLVLAMMALTALAVTGCGGEKDSDLEEGDKKYNFANFKTYISKQKLSFSYKTAKGVTVRNGKTTETTYTYDSSDKSWHYTHVQIIMGEEYHTESKAYFFIKDDFSSYEYEAKQAKMSVDKMYKFYTTKDGFKIIGNYEYDDMKTESIKRFNESGLCVYNYYKITDYDVDSVTENEQTITYK